MRRRCVVHAWRALPLALLAGACGPPPQDPGLEGDDLEAQLAAPLHDLDELARARVEAAREAVRAAPTDPRTWGRLGMLYQANDVAALAVEAYRQAAQRDPEGARWPYAEAKALHLLGENEASEAAMGEALRLAPDDAGVHWHLGLCRLERGELDAAMAAFEESVRLAPERPGGWCGLARVHLLRRETDAALDALGRALAVAPEHPWAFNLLGLAYRQAGRVEDIEAIQRRGTGGLPRWRGPFEAEVYALRTPTFMLRWEQARDLFNAGRYAETARILEELRGERHENVGLVNFVGRTYARLGRLDESAAAYRSVLEREPENREALTSLCDVLGRQGQAQEGLERIERVLERHPEYGRAQHTRAVLLGRLERPSEALEAFQRSLELDQRNPTTRRSIGWLELELFRWSDAAVTFEAALAQGDASGPVWCGLAKARAMLGQIEAAEEALTHARATPDHDPALLRRVAADIGRRRRELASQGGAGR